MPNRICRNCRRSMEIAFFERKKTGLDGYGNLCKVCRNADQRSREREKSERKRQSTFSYTQDGFLFERICASCKEKKQVHLFNLDNQQSTGYAAYCKECQSERGRDYFSRNKEKVAERYLDWVSRNRQKVVEYTKKWQQKNPEKNKESRRRTVKKNKHKHNARTRDRNARRKAVTPSWANQKEIKKFYHYAVLMSRISGIQYDVDHAVPITSDFVCGLHCEANLQIMTASENSSKNNRYWAGMW